MINYYNYSIFHKRVHQPGYQYQMKTPKQLKGQIFDIIFGPEIASNSLTSIFLSINSVYSYMDAQIDLSWN